MRRMLSLALALLMMLSLAACGEERPKDDGTDTPTVIETEPAPKTEAPTVAPVRTGHDVISLDFINTFDKKPSIKEQNIYEKDGVAIRAKSIEYDPVSGPQIVLEARNETDKELLIQAQYAAVNGFMIRPELELRVPKGKKKEAPMTLPYLSLAMADIHSLNTVSLSLRILDSKSFETLQTTEEFSLALTDTSEQPLYEATGQTAYDKNGVKVVVQGVKHDTLFNSQSVITVYMENNTEKTVSVLNNTLRVNGYDITTAMHTVVLPGMRAVDMIELFDSELDEHAVTTLDSIEVVFDVNDYDDWKVIATTDTVSVEIPTTPPSEPETDSPETQASAATEKE